MDSDYGLENDRRVSLRGFEYARESGNRTKNMHLNYRWAEKHKGNKKLIKTLFL
jgi:hypothetical protein